jgi:hypothetical protein
MALGLFFIIAGVGLGAFNLGPSAPSSGWLSAALVLAGVVVLGLRSFSRQ